jgi:D-alanyl-lipoteichoic acid acyltransferase DltB (MBOAT superfamily)
MSLLSGKFVLFFLCVFLLYYIVPVKKRWIVLLVASYFFFIVNSAKMAAFLLLTSVTTFYTGKKLGALNAETTAYIAEHKAELGREGKKEYKAVQTKRKRKVLAWSIVLNMGILCVLKYTAFVFTSVNSALAMAGLPSLLPTVRFLLPLGISFYTFSAVSYIVDVYRGKYEPDTNLLQYMLFVSYFPQMIQGPIARHDHLAHQLYEGHRFDYDRVTKGMQLVLWGLIRKFVLAERLSQVSNTIFGNYTEYAGLTMFLCTVAYGVYMYADFSGGIDIVTGLSQMLGIDLAPNFERPYFATSLSEYWNRWHISLGEWMKDYVFYTLSLSRKFTQLGRKAKKRFGVQIGKVVPAFLASFITFVLVGIWQGAGWNYVAYGFWNATIISMSVMLKPVFFNITTKLHIPVESLGWRIFSMVRTFFLTSLGRFFSGGPSLKVALVMMKSFFTVWNPQVLVDGTFMNMGLGTKDWLIVAFMIVALLVIGIMQESGIRVRNMVASWVLPVRWAVYIGAIVFLVLFGVYGPGYEAADFIYQQF